MVRPTILAWLAFAVMCLCASLAQAATIQLSHFPPDPGVLPGGGWKFTTGTTFAQPTPPRAWINGVYGSVPKIVATDTMALTGRAGTLTVAAAQRVGIAEAAAAVGRCMLGSVPICAAGTAAAVAYGYYRMHSQDDYPGTSATGPGLVADPGMAATTTSATCYRNGAPAPSAAPACYTSYSAAAAVDGPWQVNQQDIVDTSETYTFTHTACSGGGSPCYAYYNRYNNTGTLLGTGFVINVTAAPVTATISGCGASIDPFDAAYNVPAGGSPGFDGKCPTARYNHAPISEAAAATKIAAYPPADPGALWKDALKDAIDTGGQQVPAEIDVTGPSSQTGTPTSSTTTNGSGTTTTTNAPTYNYTYGGDTITYSTTNNTYTCTGASACTSATATTTTTTTTGPAAADAQKPDDPCTSNPDRLGCMKAGTAEAPTVQSDTVNVDATPDAGWGAGDGSCPAPQVVTVMGQSITIDNTLVCQFMGGIRFAVVGICGLIAAMLFVGGIKS